MRTYCQGCGYPEKQCLCEAVSPVRLSADVVIIQHPKERTHAKNTARLAQLCTHQVHVYDAHDRVAMQALASLVKTRPAALIYPSPASNALETHRTQAAGTDLWLFLDGSWKQAYGILLQYPFLQSLPAWHFAFAPQSEYTIRHTQKARSLSTLEAVAYCFATVFQDDTEALTRVQRAFVDQWRGPLSHRRT